MKGMELVIKIPKKVYDDVVMGKVLQNQATIQSAFEKGVALPEKHGPLIDIENIDEIELEDSLHYLNWYGTQNHDWVEFPCLKEENDCGDCTIWAPILIEANSGGENEEENIPEGTL